MSGRQKQRRCEWKSRCLGYFLRGIRLTSFRPQFCCNNVRRPTWVLSKKLSEQLLKCRHTTSVWPSTASVVGYRDILAENAIKSQEPGKRGTVELSVRSCRLWVFNDSTERAKPLLSRGKLKNELYDLMRMFRLPPDCGSMQKLPKKLPKKILINGRARHCHYHSSNPHFGKIHSGYMDCEEVSQTFIV